MTQQDFSNVLIRCSSLGCLFTEPRDKKAKEAGELSATAKKHLVRVYIQEVWNRRRDITTKQMDKGKLCQDAATLIFSRIDGRFYETNTERRSDDWITGEMDIIPQEDLGIDIKCSWDHETFADNLISDLDDGYLYQAQGYMKLWNLSRFKVSFCLVSAPESILYRERQKLLNNMNVISDESPEFLEAWDEMERNLTFEDIPIHQRVYSFFIERNDEIIEQIPQKVQKAREFLAQLHEKHINHNKLVLA